MLDNQYDTILDALKAARDKGFVNRFVVEKGVLRCLENNEIFLPSRITIEAYHRVEGPSDPDESAVLYLLQTTSGIKGTLIDAFGTYANPEIAELVKAIEIDREEIAGKFENKRCLNCGAVLSGLYCSQCGQKDEHLHEPFWKLAGHFIGDLFHFDSKFIHTLVPLLFKPGFLTNEFIAGHRARYMKPVPLYIFMSAIFFILFFLFNNPAEELAEDLNFISPNSSKSLDSIKTGVQDDSLFKDKMAAIDSMAIIGTVKDSGLNINLTGEKRLPSTVKAYDDSISKLPADQRPGLIRQYLNRKQISWHSRDPDELFKEWTESFIHNIPKLLFFLLPLFALVLKLVYIRRRVYLVDHAVFTLHFHAFVFLFFTLLLILSLLITLPLSYFFVMLITLFYLLIGLKKVYKQSWFKSILKLFIIMFLYLFIGFFAGLTYLLTAIIMS